MKRKILTMTLIAALVICFVPTQSTFGAKSVKKKKEDTKVEKNVEKTAVEECSKSERRCFQGLERYEAEGFEKEKRTFRYAYFHKRQDEID